MNDQSALRWRIFSWDAKRLDQLPRLGVALMDFGVAKDFQSALPWVIH